MARFQFRLQSMLKLAESQRDQCRRDLAAALEAVHVLRDRQHDIERAVTEIRATRARESVGSGIQVERLLDASRFELLLNSQLSEVHKQQEQVDEELERRRQRLVEADRQVRTLEKLRERRLTEHEQAELRKQQILLDEVATQRFRRQQ